MKNIEKLADLFEKEVETQDVFGEVSYFQEAKRLKLIAGKLTYKADKEADQNKSDKIKQAARLILKASDIIRSA